MHSHTKTHTNTNANINTNTNTHRARGEIGQSNRLCKPNKRSIEQTKIVQVYKFTSGYDSCLLD